MYVFCDFLCFVDNDISATIGSCYQISTGIERISTSHHREKKSELKNIFFETKKVSAPKENWIFPFFQKNQKSKNSRKHLGNIFS